MRRCRTIHTRRDYETERDQDDGRHDLRNGVCARRARGGSATRQSGPGKAAWRADDVDGRDDEGTPETLSGDGEVRQPYDEDAGGGGAVERPRQDASRPRPGAEVALGDEESYGHVHEHEGRA